MNVCAVIVAYNRLALLRDCVDALRQQTRRPDTILVVDNASTDGTSDWLATQADVTTLRQVNAGSAGGFARGLSWAAQAGCDWVWLMDDDCLPDRGALACLLRHADTPGIAALAPAVHNPGKGININHALRCAPGRCVFPDFGEPVPLAAYDEEAVDLDLATYTGLLVARRAIDAVGVPRAELFLHYDDTEYVFRLRRFGRVRLIPGAVMQHQSAAADYFTAARRPKFAAVWIMYYGNRNRVWLARACGAGGVRFWVACLRGLARKTVDILRLDRDHRARRILVEWLAVINGLRGNFDNELPRRVLYGSAHTGPSAGGD